MIKRNWAWIAFAVVLVLVAGYTLARWLSASHRRIDAVTAFPADLEIAKGTDIVLRRATVGHVKRLDATRWGLETAFRYHDGLGLWRPVTVFERIVARAGVGDPVSVELQQGANEIVLAVRQGQAELRFQRLEGVWIDSTSPGRRAVTVNGRSVESGKRAAVALRLLPGDYLGLRGVDLRIGVFRKYISADLEFATAKLCPGTDAGRWLPWHPDAKEKVACARATVRGAAQLGVTESFGLTKPVLKLTPSEGDAGVVPADSLSIALSPKTDLKAAIEEMVAYLNAPVASRPDPVTHFEYSVANADRALRSIAAAADTVSTTVAAIGTALRSPDGLAPALLGRGTSEALRQTLVNTAGVTGRLADPTGTLVQNAGLDPVVSSATRSMANADTTLSLVRAQVLQLSPRVELAADRVTSSMDGVESTLQSVKTAAQDITGMANSLKSPRTKAVGVGSLSLLAVATLASLLAHLKFIF